MSKMTLEQQRSQAAWAFAQEGVALAGGEYTNLAKAAPALIMNNGLMQTLAFFEDKGKAHHKALANQLRRWVLYRQLPDRGESLKLPADPGFTTIMQALLNAESAQYRQATEETLLLLRWIRQFAAALKPGD
jgi:CRISPR-associated protein Cmr5